jgi:hypothetical protein
MLSRFLAMTLSGYVRTHSHFERCSSTIELLQQSAELINRRFSRTCCLLCDIETEPQSLITEALKDLTQKINKIICS